jgi:group I intron endonuclease
MKTFGIIYKITNLVNGKMYAGQTTRSLGDRWAEHKRNALNGVDYPLYFAIRKYGVENFTVEKIDSVSSLEELNKREIFWIKELNSLTKNDGGYNVLKGGFSLSNINAEPTINLTTGMEFGSAKEMAQYYNLSYSFTTRYLMGNAKNLTGDVFRYKDEEKQKRADVREAFLVMEDIRRNKVICLDTCEIFNSIKAASKKFNISRTSIGNNLNGLSRRAGGLRFAYLESK